ncbi:hypothetical protein R3P38DRAFT_602933 [Favolaschia claudopus]|uniref:Uncharacterized protein n=1 Tax=Favolaschia claudopus TaxID=2862362 RepID=A0AAW0C9G0_9AGAR
MMEHENESQEAVIELSSNTLLGRSSTTLYVSGGIGGQGGRGGQEGGAGGNAEGPTFNISHAEGWTVNFANGNATRNAGNLVSVVNSAPPAISIFDVNLQQEVHCSDSRSKRWRRRDVVRRYYTADRKEKTLVTYEGQDAEKEWKQDAARRMELWHPSFVQLYGTVCWGDIRASIFYAALIPLRDIANIFQMPSCTRSDRLVNDGANEGEGAILPVDIVGHETRESIPAIDVSSSLNLLSEQTLQFPPQAPSPPVAASIPPTSSADVPPKKRVSRKRKADEVDLTNILTTARTRKAPIRADNL